MSPEKTELEVGKQVAVFPPHFTQVERDDTPELTQVPGPVSANWGRCEPRSPTPAEASLSTPLPVGGAKAQGRTPLFTLWPCPESRWPPPTARCALLCAIARCGRGGGAVRTPLDCEMVLGACAPRP